MIAFLAIAGIAWLVALATIASGNALVRGTSTPRDPGLVTRRAPDRATPARHSEKSVGRTDLVEAFPDLGAQPGPTYDLEHSIGGGSDWFPPGMSGCDLGGES